MAGAGQGNPPTENVVLVAVKAEREISKTPLAWALAHVVRPGDFVTLLAVIGSHKEQRRWLWSFPKFTSDCSSGRRGGLPEDRRKCDVSASCSQMALQFHGFQDQSEVNMRIKVVVSGEAAAAGGAVAEESKRVGANWIVLDRQLKHEAKGCMEELPHCNVVLMKRSNAKVLRLNLGGAAPLHMPHQPLPAFTHVIPPPAASAMAEQPAERQRREAEEEAKLRQHRIKHSTPTSSTEEDDSMVSFLREYRASTSSSSTTTGGSSSPFVCEHNPLYEGLRSVVLKFYFLRRRQENQQSSSDPSYWSPAPNTQNGRQVYWAPNDQIYISSPVAHSIPEEPSLPLAAAKTLHEAFTESDQLFGARRIGYEHADRGRDLMYQSDGRDAVSLLRSPPPPVSPLCSICRHKAPVFGKPPRWFNFGELEEATGGFSDANFVAEGGFGWVHRGLLPDGRVVVVKTLKTLAGPKGNDEFRAEVEVLSRAQHRNVVLLLGFCVEGPRRVLVYEYVCNGSLAVHLHDDCNGPIWRVWA
ncbi:unnamed protein product [Spirodela intermedia]|uniref:Protein kinase domain-containing protein n=1 Tax=Spirodela intermedia TaxID=51605 RepID=A0A7I8IKT5_SPIIN|nr:unnamed protein product [Spirodela intermedia]CAA6657752.1 unnamed protein product [Spirodela intermedia]